MDHIGIKRRRPNGTHGIDWMHKDEYKPPSLLRALRWLVGIFVMVGAFWGVIYLVALWRG